MIDGPNEKTFTTKPRSVTTHRDGGKPEVTHGADEVVGVEEEDVLVDLGLVVEDLLAEVAGEVPLGLVAHQADLGDGLVLAERTTVQVVLFPVLLLHVGLYKAKVKTKKRR